MQVTGSCPYSGKDCHCGHYSERGHQCLPAEHPSFNGVDKVCFKIFAMNDHIKHMIDNAYYPMDVFQDLHGKDVCVTMNAGTGQRSKRDILIAQQTAKASFNCKTYASIVIPNSHFRQCPTCQQIWERLQSLIPDPQKKANYRNMIWNKNIIVTYQEFGGSTLNNYTNSLLLNCTYGKLNDFGVKAIELINNFKILFENDYKFMHLDLHDGNILVNELKHGPWKIIDWDFIELNQRTLGKEVDYVIGMLEFGSWFRSVNFQNTFVSRIVLHCPVFYILSNLIYVTTNNEYNLLSSLFLNNWDYYDHNTRVEIWNAISNFYYHNLNQRKQGSTDSQHASYIYGKLKQNQCKIDFFTDYHMLLVTILRCISNILKQTQVQSAPQFVDLKQFVETEMTQNLNSILMAVKVQGPTIMAC